MATTAYRDKRLLAAEKKLTAYNKAIDGWEKSIKLAREEIARVNAQVKWLVDMPVDAPETDFPHDGNPPHDEDDSA